MMEPKVIQKPGPALVEMPGPSLFISWRTSTKRAISMANAIIVTAAAKNENIEAISVTSTWLESAGRSATNVTAVARG